MSNAPPPAAPTPSGPGPIAGTPREAAPDRAQTTRLDPEEQLTKVAASVPGVICSFRLAPDGHASMPYASPAILDLYGLTPAAVAETFDPILAALDPADIPGVWDSVAASARTLSPWHAEFRYRHPTKGEIWIEGHSMPLREAGGGVLWHGYLQDITERKRSETRIREAAEALRRERDLLQSVMDAAPNVQLAYLDLDFNFVRVNAPYAESCGKAPADLIGLNHFALFPSAEVQAILTSVRDTGVPVSFHDRPFNFPNQPARGLTYWDWVLTPIRDPDGTVQGLVLSLTETTQRKRVEEALKTSQADLNRAQTLGQIGSWRLELPANEATWSPENYRIWGNPEGGPLDYDGFIAHVHPADRDFARERWQAALAGERYDFEHRIIVGDTVKWVRERAELEFDERGEVRSVFGTTQDITERREAADQLLTQLRLIKAITDCAAEAIFVTDEQGRVTFMNPEAVRTFGYPAEELQGRLLRDVICPRQQDEDGPPGLDCPGPGVFDGSEAVRNSEAVYVRKDGSTLTAAVSSAPLEIGGQHRGAVLVAHDISAIKSAQARLLDADRRKDEFLAMLAHELRNPLAPIRNAAHVLSLLDTAEPRMRWAQHLIEQQAAHLTRVVDDLLDVSRFARGEITLKPVLIDFNEIARQVVQGAHSLIRSKDHHFELDLPAEPLWINCDVVRLSQVLVNLIDNAVKYTPSGGRLRLRARGHRDDIEITLEDNGMGIPAELLPLVFDLFQQGSRTLDRSKGGLGLGLTLVRRLVQAHGGRVVAESAGSGRGTRMRLWLPRPPPGAVAPPRARSAAPEVAPLRILVVDDEAAVADSTALLLRLDGHAVQVARAGPAAIQIAASFQPQVVLLDIGLRGMDGYQTARQLRARHRADALCLIAVTGYGDAQARERARVAGFDHYLVKPVEPGRLKQLLAGIAAGKGVVPGLAPPAEQDQSLA